MAAHLKYKSGNSWIDYNLVIYPVGALYISYSSTSPASLFGGTWTPITGRFPYFNAGISTGGSNTHTLSTNEIPSHRHQLQLEKSARSATGFGLTSSTSFYDRVIVSHDGAFQSYQESFTSYVGGGKAHNNMPAYQTFYAWRRTA